jgi:hypothetical protein
MRIDRRRRECESRFSPESNTTCPLPDFAFDHGSGSTLIAAEKTGRKARLIEFDPAYCDRIVRRFEQATGKQARLGATDQPFEIVAEERASNSPSQKGEA